MVDLRYSIERGLTVAEIACFLKRTDAEVQNKAMEPGMGLDIKWALVGPARLRFLPASSARHLGLRVGSVRDYKFRL